MDTFILIIIAIGMLGIPISCFFTLLTLLFKKWKPLLKYSLVSLGLALICTTMGLISYGILVNDKPAAKLTDMADSDTPMPARQTVDNSIETPNDRFTESQVVDAIPMEWSDETIENNERADASNEVLVETMLAMIESDLIQAFGKDNYTISCDYDNKIVTLDVWKEGVAAELTLIKLQGGDASDENWMFVKNSFVNVAKSICELIDNCGHEDFTLLLNIRNDANLENGLLSIFNTTIIYDVMEE